MTSAVTVLQSGSQTCVISTNHQLTTTINTQGVLQLKLDASNSANGDTFEVRFERKVRAADSAQFELIGTWSNALGVDNAVLEFDPVMLGISCAGNFYLKQTAGTGRVVKWSVEQADG